MNKPITTTPAERAAHVYTATLWLHLDRARRDDPAFRQEIESHIAYEIEQAVGAATSELHAACDEMLGLLCEYFGAVHDDSPMAEVINRVGALVDRTKGVNRG